MTYRNGSVYEGDFADGKREGHGTLTKANGDVYEGDFENDAMTGIGKYTFKNGAVAYGAWKDGRLEKRLPLPGSGEEDAEAAEEPYEDDSEAETEE